MSVVGRLWITEPHSAVRLLSFQEIFNKPVQNSWEKYISKTSQQCFSWWCIAPIMRASGSFLIIIPHRPGFHEHPIPSRDHQGTHRSLNNVEKIGQPHIPSAQIFFANFKLMIHNWFLFNPHHQGCRQTTSELEACWCHLEPPPILTLSNNLSLFYCFVPVFRWRVIILHFIYFIIMSHPILSLFLNTGSVNIQAGAKPGRACTF